MLILLGLFPTPQIAPAQQILGDPVALSQDFTRLENTHFIGNRVVSFNPATGAGTLAWKRYACRPTYGFNKMDKGFSPDRQKEDFPTEYDADPGVRIDYQTGRVHRGAG
jgi:alpha-D-xyloside xylohydrolase